MMKQMKLPIFLCPQDRLPSSSFNHSLSSGNSSSSSSFSSAYSPSSVLPTKPKLKEKRPLPPPPLCVERNEVRKKRKVVKSSSSTSTSAGPPLSPTSLHQLKLKVRFADLLLKTNLQNSRSDPVTVQRELVELKRTQLEDKKKLDAYLREEQRLADLEAKRKQEEIEKERQRLEQEQRERQRIKERELAGKKRVEAQLREAQRKRERLVREKMEAAAAREQSYCCTLMELGVLTECDHALSWGFWGGQRQSPLEKLGLFIKKDHGTDFREVELEEGEINEELQKGEILFYCNR